MSSKEINRRDFLKIAGKFAAGGALSSLLPGCGTTPPTEAPKTEPSATPVSEATKTPFIESATSLPTETVVFQTPAKPTEEIKPTLPPETEVIVFPQTQITAEFLKQGFTNIGGEEVELEGKMVSLESIEGYASSSWDEAITLADLAQDEVKSFKALISLGAQAGVEGFYRPGEAFPQFGDLTLLRLTINQLPNNQDFYDAKLNASPWDLIIRKGTHLTIAGLWADASGRWATVVIDEGFDREKESIQARIVPRHFLAVIPQNLPPESEGLSLEKLLNANNYIYGGGVIEHLGETGKLYRQELNIVEPSFAKKLEREAGALFMDQKPDGTWYENPVIPYPPSEEKSTHTVSQGETVSKIAEGYGMTVEEIMKTNPEITDPSKINVGQEITILIPGFTNYHGPTLTEDNRVVILSQDQTQELAQASYNKETKEWVWEKIVVAQPTPEPIPTQEPEATKERTQEQPTKEPTAEATKEPTPIKEPGVLYEKDFEHLRNAGGEWQFGKIYNEFEDEMQTQFFLTSVILSEPEKRPINALDSNGNVIYTYESWFVKVGYTDPKSEEGKLVEGETEVWPEDVPEFGRVIFAKNGFIGKEDLGGNPTQIPDRDRFLSLFKFGKPVIAAIVASFPSGRAENALKQFNINEPFPGTSDMAKKIYYYGSMLDRGFKIRLDLPPTPTFEEIKRWKTEGQLPPTSFLGQLIRLIISDK